MSWMNWWLTVNSIVVLILMVSLAVKFSEIDDKFESHNNRIKNLARKIKKESEYQERRLR